MAIHLSEQKQADYSDYLRRFQSDPQSISAEEAARRYQELMHQAPPELAAEANQHIMGMLPQNERDVLASNIQGGQQTPQTIGLLDHILGQDSVLNTPLGKMILSAAVAYLINRLLSQQQGQAGTSAPSGGLGDLISTILNGAAATQAQGGNQAPASQAPSGGLGDILGGLLGGQAQGNQQVPAGQVPTGGLGDILGALMGGQAQAGGQAPSGGLGDILGGLLGGQAPAADQGAEQPPVRTHRKQ